MTFGAKLRRMRTKKGWSLRELGRRSGLNYVVIHALERTHNPRLEHVGTLATAFGVTPIEVLRGVQFPRKSRPVARTAG